MDQITAYPTAPVSPGDTATVALEGELQECVCGNHTRADDWAAADRNGVITFAAAGSANEDDHAVCPSCGRVYRNADLFLADLIPAAAVARYDTTSPEFVAAIARYNRDAYGDSGVVAPSPIAQPQAASGTPVLLSLADVDRVLRALRQCAAESVTDHGRDRWVALAVRVSALRAQAAMTRCTRCRHSQAAHDHTGAPTRCTLCTCHTFTIHHE